MNVKKIYLDEVDSTNNWLRKYVPAAGEDITVVWTQHQTAGRGMGTNTWESEPGKNLTFSILAHPVMVPLNRQFLLSMADAVAIKDALDKHTGGIELKWPNDIYYHDRKLGGTLIETTLRGGHITDCIFGTGINVNQTVFTSDAPNPVSLKQITGKDADAEQLLNEITDSFKNYYELISEGDYTDIAALYHNALYRRHGYYKYQDRDGYFEASIVEVTDSGHLVLHDREGVIREYDLKEIKFIL